MKKYIINIFALGALLVVGSCNMERKPELPETPELVKAEDGLQYLLNGAYRQLGDAGNGVVVNMFRNGIFGGDEINLSGVTTDSMMAFYDLVRNPRGARQNEIWIQSYKTIYTLNSILNNQKEGVSDKSDHLLGEAYYLRALTNFYLLETFAKQYVFGRDNLGIPLKTSTDEKDIPARATVGESYDFVVEDLLKAERLMEKHKVDNIQLKIKASKAAAQALLARVYLFMDKQDKALEYANKVINSGVYSLLPKDKLDKYPRFVPENNSETIFAFRFDSTNYSAWFGLSSMFATIQGIGWGEMYVSDRYLHHIRMFPQDVRNNFIVPDYKKTKEGKKIPAIYWTEFDENGKVYNYREGLTDENYTTYAYVANKGRPNEKTYKGEIHTETLEYGGNSYTKSYIIFGGKKHYVHKEFVISNRNGFPKYFMYKNSLQEEKDHLYSPVISRLAEMYLIRAEVYAKKGEDARALQEVNIIRERAGAPAFAKLPLDKSALDIVMEERWLEFAYEGHRKFDLVRNRMPIDRRFPGVHLSQTRTKEIVQPDDDELVFFIPENEVNRNPNIKQNP